MRHANYADNTRVVDGESLSGAVSGRVEHGSRRLCEFNIFISHNPAHRVYSHLAGPCFRPPYAYGTSIVREIVQLHCETNVSSFGYTVTSML